MTASQCDCQPRTLALKWAGPRCACNPGSNGKRRSSLLRLITCWRVPLRDNTSQSLRWSGVCADQLWAVSELSRHRGHTGVSTPGEGFSSNSTPDFSDNTGLLRASPPSVGFNSNKGLLAMGASLSGQIMLSDFPATYWGMRMSGLNLENFLVWELVWSPSNQSWCKFVRAFFFFPLLRIYMNVCPLCLME